MKRTIKIENIEISYTLIIKNVRNINLRIQQNGEIIVSCNAYVPLSKIDKMVEEKARWIIKKMTQIKRKRDLLTSTSSYLYLGKQYKIQPIFSTYTKVNLYENICEVYYTENKSIEDVLNEFEIETSRKYLTNKTQEIFEKMSVDYNLKQPSLKIRKMTSRWGSCMPSKWQITLNRMLIHYNERFIEYVVIHEFAHFIQPNHSKAFYHVIEKYMPDYKEVSKNGPNLILLNDEIVV